MRLSALPDVLHADRLPAKLAALSVASRKKRWGIALLLGIMAALTLPPVYLYPLLIPAFSGLLLLSLYARSGRAAFATGWWFGFGYFTVGLYWMAISMLVEPEKFAWMIPFALFGMPSVLAIYYGLACWLFWRLPLKHPLCRVLLFALIWLGTEWLRGILFTGFPWNLIGYSWTFSTAMIQPAYWIGSYGLTFWTVLLATLPALLYWPGRRYAATPVLVALFVMLALPFAIGVWRLSTHPTQYSDTVIRVVQANIPQDQKWHPALRMRALEKHVRLSSARGAGEVDLFIWPESAFPFLLQPKQPPLTFVTPFLQPEQRLITGAIHTLPTPSGPPESWPWWNSLHVVDNEANVTATYDKYKLVPFGEFVPFRGILPVEKLTHGMQDFSRGPGPELITPRPQDPAFLPLICYEGIFPSLSNRQMADGKKAEWLLSITNDAWFGISSGPYQHLHMTRLRAVEQGIPLIRSANTGISAVIDAYGRVLTSLPLEEEGIITTRLPLISSHTSR